MRDLVFVKSLYSAPSPRVTVGRRMWSIADIEAALGPAQQPIVSPPSDRRGAFTGISIDSRTLQPGDLFFCIVGDRTDGHDYVAQALSQGARGAVLSRAGAGESSACLAAGAVVFRVADTTLALGSLAAAHRARLSARVIGVTGSNGKTTTKELLSAVAEVLEPGRVLASVGNLNNHWGLPLSLLAARSDHRVLVLEMGMNHAGEISALSKIARPHAGVIVSVSGAHIGHFGSIEEIVRAKLELADGIESGGFLLYNRSSPGLELAHRVAEERKLQLCAFGVEDKSRVKVTAEGLLFPWRGRELLAPDWFNPVLVDNRIAALEALVALGYPEGDVAAASETVRVVVPGRFFVRRMSGPLGPRFLVDDTYNANEASFVAAIEAAANLRPTGRLGLVAGEMGELGEMAVRAHAHVGAAAGSSRYDLVVVAGGSLAREITDAYLNRRPSGRCHFRPDAISIVEDAAVVEELFACDVVLVKGSRSSRMERVVAALQEKGYV